MVDQEFLEYETIARYARSLDDLSPDDRDKRLQILADFAKFVERTPDEMIKEVFNEETRKYRRRGFYTDKAKEFAEATEANRNLALQRSNVIRGFFIANGRRLLPEMPAWMTSA